jgi:hypothetical protein
VISNREYPVDATYIIFKRSASQNNPVWVETVQGLEKGKKRLIEYKSSSADDYYLFDVREARVLDVLARAKSA